MGICHLGPALRGGCVSDDVEAELSQSILWESYLLVSILAAVLGGVNPDGGSGRIVGMVLALFLLQIIESGFNILGISPYLTMALWGALLLCFIRARGMLGLERAG